MPTPEVDFIVDLDKRRYLFEQVLPCLDREENLIHYRLSWGLQWNAAFVAAVFAMHNVNGMETIKSVLDIGIALLGIVVSGLSFLGVWAAQAQSDFLIRSLASRLRVEEQGWREFIRPHGELDTVHRAARIVSTWIPLTPIGFWFALIVFAIRAYPAAL